MNSVDASIEGLDEFNAITGLNVSVNQIKYEGRDGTDYAESSTPPVEVGNFTAKLTLGEEDSAVTASVKYASGQTSGQVL